MNLCNTIFADGPVCVASTALSIGACSSLNRFDMSVESGLVLASSRYLVPSLLLVLGDESSCTRFMRTCK